MKIDSEKSYNHNFFEDINVALSKADENLKRDPKLSFEDEIQVPSTIDQNDLEEDKAIYDDKTITEITCPDKVVISENIIKDVCIDEGAKVSPIKIEENEMITSSITEEGEEIALKTVQDHSSVPDEKEVVIGEILDEKTISLKELFFSEDKKSADLHLKKIDEKKSAVQSIEKHSPEATVTTGSDASEPVESSKVDVSSDEITEEHPASLPVLSGTEMNGTEEMSDTSRSVPSCHAEAENGHNFDGPKITSRMSFSQHCGELNIPQMELPGNNSARIAYSGSLSIRSDSSTTSARSFAFPIMQNEWNSSPIKMAKADRRRYRKHRGWRSNLFCCSF
ncbi:uncharacterized protein LOC144560368 [Carex rostrata]